ncbi:MAG: esterase-like activity of phytase family protein, partial [Vicinamibacterales bacterium]
NRGIESVALAPDGASLYLIVQNPLANPNEDAYKAERMTRLLQFDPATRKVIGEYVYLLDTPDTFRQDKSDKQNDVRLSEMTVTPAGELVVLERISKTTKLHRVSFDGATNILGTPWDDTATAPSLEQLSEADLPGQGLAPVGKTLLFDSADYDGLPAKIEGVTFVDDRTMLQINDDDFGIDGARTEIFRLPAPKDATN